MKSIDKHSLRIKGRLWNLLNGLEIYSTNLGINERGMRTHLSLSSCTYTCSYLQWEWLRSARRRSKCCTGLWQRSKVSLCNVEFDYVLTLKTKTLNNFPALYWFLLAKKKHKRNVFSWSRAPMSSNAFSNPFLRRYRISDFRISTWYLFTHSDCFCIRNLTRWYDFCLIY